MATTTTTLLFAFLALPLGVTLAADHSPLQDFCVADPTSQALVNGVACKSPSMVGASDFSFNGLHLAGNTSNAVGSRVSPVFESSIMKETGQTYEFSDSVYFGSCQRELDHGV